jgi:hypothetical protein
VRRSPLWWLPIDWACLFVCSPPICRHLFIFNGAVQVHGGRSGERVSFDCYFCLQETMFTQGVGGAFWGSQWGIIMGYQQIRPYTRTGMRFFPYKYSKLLFLAIYIFGYQRTTSKYSRLTAVMEFREHQIFDPLFCVRIAMYIGSNFQWFQKFYTRIKQNVSLERVIKRGPFNF